MAVTRTRIALLVAAVAVLATARAEAGIASGSYTGNGAPSAAITGVGFQPDVVIIKADSAIARAVIRTATMGLTKEMTGAAAAAAGYVLSLDTNGFTVSGNARVNQAGVTYHWIAFETVSGESRLASYTGNGIDNRSITGLGFTPAYVITIPESTSPAYHRSSLMLESYSFDSTTGQPNHIQAMVADGFQIGDDGDVNRNGFVYHYVAWRAVPGRMAVGSYIGLENDNRAITGVGFRPAYVVVKADDNWSAAHKPVSTGPATDDTLLFNLNASQADNIQALQADGFQVGRQERVNSAGRSVFWMAWGLPAGGLSTGLGGSTITVTTPAAQMVWDAAKGGGLRQFFATAEANPGTSRVGWDASYNLFATWMNGIQEAAATGQLQLLEATRSRVRIRQKRDFVPGPSGAHLERDWSVYATPRLGIAETLTFDVALAVQGTTGLHAKGETSCGAGNTFYCAGRADNTNRVWLATDNGTTYSDMLALPYTTAFFGRAGTSPVWENTAEAGTPNSWVSRVREIASLPAVGTDRRAYLVHPHLEGLTSGGTQWQPYANGYRSPSTLALAQGTAWVDPAESTTAGDAFNEAEDAYVMNADPVTGLDFSIDGSAALPRVQPFFKIRQWRSLQEPATVLLQGTALVKDRDFTADVKPVAHAATCPAADCASYTPLARGGLVGDPEETLADPGTNSLLPFLATGANYLYLGADARFRGLNVSLQVAGTGGASLTWEYWDGSAWADLGAVPGFADLTASFARDGVIFWTADPPGWSPREIVASGPRLYYVRASLASGPAYVVLPVERQIKTDILLFQYLGNVTASARRFVLASATSLTFLRSIGSRPNYGTGQPEGGSTSVSATLGSTVVTGASTAWRTANRGRGDRIQIGGFDYTVAAVLSETDLELTTPYAEAAGTGKSYSISRKFTSLDAWEDCIDGPGGAGCEGVASPSLVTDGRSEVGILYRDTPMPGGLTIDGSATDANHTITLTADHGNRHYGRAGAIGMVALIDNTTSVPGIRVRDDHVRIEWLEIRGGTGTSAHGVEVDTLSVVNRVVLDDLLVHGTPSNGIEIEHADAVVDAYDNVVYETGLGIHVATTPSGTSQIQLLNNTVFGCNGGGPSGIRSAAASNPGVTLRNNIAVSNNGGDFGVPSPSGASSHNLSGDATGPAHSPGGSGIAGVAPAALFVSMTPGAEDLHLLPAAVAVDSGADLGALFTGDIDAGVRTGTWDRGADEVGSGATDLAILKDDGSGTAVPGESVSYTITVTNNGPAAVSSLKVVDVLPPFLSSPVFTPSRGSYNPGTGAWDVSALPLLPGQFATLTLLASIDPLASGFLANTATVFPPAGVADPVPPNDSSTDTDVLTPSADLSLTHDDNPDPVDLGGLLVYTLVVTNGGPSAATGVVLTDLLPPEMEFDSVTPSQGDCAFDGPSRTLACDLGGLSPGSATVTLSVRPRGLGTFTANASVTRNEPDPVSGNDSKSATTTVQTPSFAVRFITVTSISQRNVIEWLNPTAAEYLSTELVFRTDRFPTNPGDGTSLYDAGASGAKDRFVHDTPPLVDGQVYYYGAFVHRSAAPLVSPGRFVTGRPFATAGDVKWAFSTGGFSVTPPTVGGAGIIATSNDLAVHAMARGPAGGEWPAGWLPFQVGGPVQSRSPVVPLTFGGANPVLFLGAQDGSVYSLSAALGGAAPPPWPPAAVAAGKVVQAAPAGVFAAYGGGYDYLLVGTRDATADNVFAAIDPATGTVFSPRSTTAEAASGSAS